MFFFDSNSCFTWRGGGRVWGAGCLILGAVACNHPQHNPFPRSNYSLAMKTGLAMMTIPKTWQTFSSFFCQANFVLFAVHKIFLGLSAVHLWFLSSQRDSEIDSQTQAMEKRWNSVRQSTDILIIRSPPVAVVPSTIKCCRNPSLCSVEILV